MEGRSVRGRCLNRLPAALYQRPNHKCSAWRSSTSHSGGLAGRWAGYRAVASTHRQSAWFASWAGICRSHRRFTDRGRTPCRTVFTWCARPRLADDPSVPLTTAEPLAARRSACPANVRRTCPPVRSRIRIRRRRRRSSARRARIPCRTPFRPGRRRSDPAIVRHCPRRSRIVQDPRARRHRRTVRPARRKPRSARVDRRPSTALRCG